MDNAYVIPNFATLPKNIAEEIRKSGKDVSIPWNVVSAPLRAALRAEGIKIGEPVGLHGAQLEEARRFMSDEKAAVAEGRDVASFGFDRYQELVTKWYDRHSDLPEKKLVEAAERDGLYSGRVTEGLFRDDNINVDHKWVDGEKRFSRTGVRNDGIEVFSTNDNVSKMTNAERIKEFERLMREEYRGRTARFMIDGNPIYARFEGDDIRKIVHGDKKSSPHNFKAKMKVGASGDIFDLVENSRYRKPKDESGKTTDAHDGVDRWDYFNKTVQIDDGVYDVHIDVRRRKNDSANMPDEFIYNVYLTHSNKKADHQSLNRASENGIAYGSGYRPTAHGYGESTFKNVPQNGGEVNTGRTVKESTGDNGVRDSRRVTPEDDKSYADALLDEIFAHRFMKEHGEEFRKMLEKSANRTWWGKMKDGVREMYRRIAGKTKVDLDGLVCRAFNSWA